MNANVRAVVEGTGSKVSCGWQARMGRPDTVNMPVPDGSYAPKQTNVTSIGRFRSLTGNRLGVALQETAVAATNVRARRFIGAWWSESRSAG